MYRSNLKPPRPGEGRIRHLLHNNPLPETLDVPQVYAHLHQMGTNIKLARLRRRLSAGELSYRAGISRSTLWRVEKGAPEIGIGVYAKVLFMLKMEHEINKWGVDDQLGQKIRDEEMLMKKRGPVLSIPPKWH